MQVGRKYGNGKREKKHVDLLPNGYKIVRQSLVDDLRAKKRYVGRQKFCRMMIVDLLMKSAGVCIFDTCKGTWLCRVLQSIFATMTGMLMEY